MKAIIDCGSTKCDYLFLPEKIKLQSKGFNPNVSGNSVLENNLTENKELFNTLHNCDEIKFYGAGCSKSENQERIKSVLLKHFPNSIVFVKHDLDLSVEALSENHPCFINILGTGSNSIYFDGQKTNSLYPSLGFILGDEGSGTWLGRQILKDYFYKKLPHEISKFIDSDSEISYEQVISKVYNSDSPNRFIASFAKYLGEFKNNEYAQNVLAKGFSDFLEVYIPKTMENSIPLHFTGSIAFHFKEELKKAVENRGLKLGTVLKSPLEGF